MMAPLLEVSSFTGEAGGLLALAFGMGASAGYGFAVRTVLRIANSRIQEVKDNAASQLEAVRSHAEAQIKLLTHSSEERMAGMEDRLADLKAQQRRDEEECDRRMRSLEQRNEELSRILLGRAPLPPKMEQELGKLEGLR